RLAEAAVEVPPLRPALLPLPLRARMCRHRHSPHSRPRPPLELVKIITMYLAPREGVKSGVSSEGRRRGQRRQLGPRALFLLLAAGGEVDDVLAERGRLGGIEGGVPGRPDAGMEHDVEREAQRCDPEWDDGVPLVRVRGE